MKPSRRAQCQTEHHVLDAEGSRFEGLGLVHKDDKADGLGPSRRQTAQYDLSAKDGRTAAQDIQDGVDSRRLAHRYEKADRTGPGQLQIEQTDPRAGAEQAATRLSCER